MCYTIFTASGAALFKTNYKTNCPKKREVAEIAIFLAFNKSIALLFIPSVRKGIKIRRSQLLGGVVITYPGEVSVPYVTSERLFSFHCQDRDPESGRVADITGLCQNASIDRVWSHCAFCCWM